MVGPELIQLRLGAIAMVGVACGEHAVNDFLVAVKPFGLEEGTLVVDKPTIAAVNGYALGVSHSLDASGAFTTFTVAIY